MSTVTVYDSTRQLSNRRRFVSDSFKDFQKGIGLAQILFRSALRAQMRRSLLGHLWLVIPAAVAALAVTYIQANRLVSLPDTQMPLAVFVFAGTTLWQLFLESLNAPSRQIAIHRTTVTRMRVPHEALVLAGAFEAGLNASARFLVLLLLCWATGANIGPWAITAIPAAIPLIALGLAIGLLLSPLTLLFEDGSRGVMLLTNLLVFVMPVLYPIPSTGWQRFNLLVPLIDTPRNLLTGLPLHPGYVLAAAISFGLLLIAWPFYRLARLHIVSRLG